MDILRMLTAIHPDDCHLSKFPKTLENPSCGDTSTLPEPTVWGDTLKLSHTDITQPDAAKPGPRSSQ